MTCHDITSVTDLNALASRIAELWEQRATLNPQTTGQAREDVEAVLSALDHGTLRAASKNAAGVWEVHGWVKQAILLSFRLNDNQRLAGMPHVNGQLGAWWDKVPLKFAAWREDDFRASGIRVCPGSIVRRGVWIGRSVVLMPGSFVNCGAWIGANTMIDSCTTVASCVQIGEQCHISSNSMLGGVLEPPQAEPVIIEDNCFIGAMVGIAEGTFVGEGAVIGMGVTLSATTKIVDRETGEIFIGRVPAGAVVVPGSLPAEAGKPALACAVIVKRVDAKTRARTSINDLLRA